MKKTVFILMALLLMPIAMAQQSGHLKLLAVKEEGEVQKGSIADLYLEIKPGTGRVYIDTFPATRVDTQISTRFARDIACNTLNVDCNTYDFFYRITADSAIIGGPSAGAGTALLTVSLLENAPLDESIAVTGTINPGGLVGSVGGLQEKIEAGAQAGLKKILIPVGRRYLSNLDLNLSNGTNRSIDLVAIGKEKGVDVKEVATLNDVFYEFTGRYLENPNGKFEIDKEYTATMRNLAIDLCNRSTRLEGMYQRLAKESLNRTDPSALESYQKGKKAFDDGIYYSSASFCFGSNIRYTFALLQKQNFSSSEIHEKIKQLIDGIKEFDKRLEDKEQKTLTDLEAYMIVKERLIEADKYVKEALDTEGDEQLFKMAYASERLYSAVAWFKFFDHRGKEFRLEPEFLQASCKQKLSEAEERYQYAMSTYEGDIGSTGLEIDRGYNDMNKGNFALCLFKASKAKAEADAILSSVGIDREQAVIILEQRKKVIENLFSKEARKEIFPILGYSYYEYANALKEEDIGSALLYSEYALELGNLDIYFEEKKALQLPSVDLRWLIVFVGGLAVGWIVAYSVMLQKFRKKGERSINPSRTRKRILLGKKR